MRTARLDSGMRPRASSSPSWGTNPGETVAPAVFTPDGQWIVAGSEKEVRLRDGKTGRPLAVLGHHEHLVVGRRSARMAGGSPLSHAVR